MPNITDLSSGNTGAYISQPVAELESLRTTVEELKQVVEALVGVSGQHDRAITARDLISLGLMEG